MGLVNRCAYLDKEHRFEIREEPVKAPRDDEVQIRIRANGICGSDIHFFADGRLGNFEVTVPYIPGHEASGDVVSTGAGVKGFKPGDRVVIEPGVPCGRCKMCMSGRYNLCPDVVFFSAPPVNGTFCDYINVRSDFVFPIPDNMSYEHAAMIEPVAVGVHAANRAGFIGGKEGLVFGAGPIGLLTLQAFKAAGGGRVTCVDLIDRRLEKALELGADEVINPAKSDKDITNYADVVFETAGAPATTAQLFHAARPGGTAVQVGWPAGNVVNMNVADMIDRELTYTAVNRYCNAYPEAIRYVSDGRIRVEPVITHRFTFMDIYKAFDFAHTHADEVIKVVVTND